MLIIGDTHLGIKDKADDFWMPALGKEKKLIDLIDNEPEELVFNDFLDGTENDNESGRIALKYPKVFCALERRQANGLITTFLESNHHGKNFPFPQVPILVYGDYVIFHGHHLDIFNSRLKFIGEWITKIGSFLERSGLSNIDLIFNAFQKGRFGGNEAYYSKLERWVDKHPQYEGATIIMAHTHEHAPIPKELRNCQVMNAGTTTGNHWETIRI